MGRIHRRSLRVTGLHVVTSVLSALAAILVTAAVAIASPVASGVGGTVQQEVGCTALNPVCRHPGVAGATVHIRHFGVDAATAVTDQDGHYSAWVRPGTYMVVLNVTVNGEHYSRTVTVGAGHMTICSWLLPPGQLAFEAEPVPSG